MMTNRDTKKEDKKDRNRNRIQMDRNRSELVEQRKTIQVEEEADVDGIALPF